MAPSQSFIGPTLRPRWAAAFVSLALASVSLPTVVHAQGQESVEPTVGQAVADEREPEQGQNTPPPSDTPDRETPRNPTPGEPESSSAGQPPSAQTGAQPAVTSAVRAVLDAAQAAAAKRREQPSEEELRQRVLDTSFPAEQPHMDVPEQPREVIAPPLPLVSPRGPSRRTVVRVIDGVTVLTNVTDEPEYEDTPQNAALAPRAPGPTSPQESTEPATLVAPRDVTVNSNALSPVSKAETSKGSGLWLWVLGGFAVLSLVPIGVLLTRPVRRG